MHVLDETGKRGQEELNRIMMRLQYPLVYVLVSMNRRVRGQCARWAGIGRSSGGTTDQGVRSRASRHLHALRRDSHFQHLAPVPLLSPTATISPVFNTVEASVWPLDSSARPFDPLHNMTLVDFSKINQGLVVRVRRSMRTVEGPLLSSLAVLL